MAHDTDAEGRREADDQPVDTVPVVEERLSIGKRVISGRTVRLEKKVDEERVELDETLLREELEVERHQVGRVLADDEEPTVEQRDGVVVIPLIEERLVVRTERVLREEIHLHRRTETRRVQDEVPLRRERMEVKEVNPDGEAR